MEPIQFGGIGGGMATLMDFVPRGGALLDGRLSRPSHRQRYEAMRDELKARLSEVENAIAALDAHPELEEFIEVLGRVGL